MLGKLIKYDMKSLNRYLILIHAFLLAASLCIRIFLTGNILVEGFEPDNPQFGLSVALSIVLYVLVITGVYFATYLVIVIRFYKNLFSDQGYLTHTLPVTGGQNLLSKTISGSIWGCIDMFLICLSVYVVCVTPYIRHIFLENKAEIRAELGFTGAYANLPFAALAVMFILFALLGVISNLIIYYASIAIGHLVPGHKILGAIASYFVLNTIFSILSLLVLALSGLLGASIHPAEDFVALKYFIDSLKISGILCGTTAVILYIATYWIMSKKINLE